MAKKPETYLSNHISEYLESQGAEVINIHGSIYGDNGIADLIVNYMGLFIALEVKKGSNKPNAKQQIFLKRINHKKGIALAVWSLGEVVELIHAINEEMDLTGLAHGVKLRTLTEPFSNNFKR